MGNSGEATKPHKYKQDSKAMKALTAYVINVVCTEG